MLGYNPFKDAKFLTGLAEAFVALVAFFVGKYYPAAAEDVNFVFKVTLPIALSLIAGFTVRDIATLLPDESYKLTFLKRK